MTSRSNVRPPAVAGQFYAGTAEALRGQVDTLLAAADGSSADVPRAVIAPHAGFMFSGSVAATAYGRLTAARGHIRRVIVLGPSHFVPVRGLAASSADWFETPLGRLPVDADGLAAVRAHREVIVDDRAHGREHSVETHLPFIQRVLGEVSILPLVVGNATPEAVGRVLAEFWEDDATVIAISSDLSHFHDDATARERDRATATTIEALGADRLGPRDACGYLPIGGLLWNAARRGTRVCTLELRNSGDAGAPRSSVVGYGAFVASAEADA